MTGTFNIGHPNGPEILIPLPPIKVGEHMLQLEPVKKVRDLATLDQHVGALCLRLHCPNSDLTAWDAIFIAPAMRQFWNTANPTIGGNASKLFVHLISNWIAAELAKQKIGVVLVASSSSFYELSQRSGEFVPSAWSLLDIIGEDYTRYEIPLPINLPSTKPEDLKPLA